MHKLPGVLYSIWKLAESNAFIRDRTPGSKGEGYVVSATNAAIKNFKHPKTFYVEDNEIP